LIQHIILDWAITKVDLAAVKVNAKGTEVELTVDVDSVAKSLIRNVELNLVLVFLDLTTLQLISAVAESIQQSPTRARIFLLSRASLSGK
jgi:hypothetical protein